PDVPVAQAAADPIEMESISFDLTSDGPALAADPFDVHQEQVTTSAHDDPALHESPVDAIEDAILESDWTVHSATATDTAVAMDQAPTTDWVRAIDSGSETDSGSGIDSGFATRD